MGNACSKDTNINKGELPQDSASLRLSQTASLVLPDIKDMKELIKQKTNQMDIDITLSDRGSKSSDLSLLLPACKSIPATLIIRYFLVYSFYIAKYSDKKSSKKEFQALFYELLDKLSTDQKQKQPVSVFKQEVDKQSNDAKQSVIVVNCSFKHSFLLESINKVLLLSKDPKDLSYFIFPIYALNNGIKQLYQKQHKSWKENIWIVAVLSSNEIELLNKMENKENYFFFSAFIRGFTSEDDANQQFKLINKANKNKTVLFTVNFLHHYEKLSQAENNGFYIFKNPDEEIKKKGDVLFNIMTSFKLASKTQKNKYDLQYGELAALEHMKSVDRTYGKQPFLLKVSQLCRGVSKFYLKSQSCLFRIINNNRQSLGVSHTILSNSKASTINATDDIQRQNLVNTHIEKGQYTQAMKKAEERDSLIFKAKKIQILYESNKKDEAKQEIAKVGESEKKKKENLEARLIIDLISARLEMSNGEYKKANTRLKELYRKIQGDYSSDFEYIGRDVIVALIECEKRGKEDSTVEEVLKPVAEMYTGIGGNSLQLSSLSVKNK